MGDGAEGFEGGCGRLDLGHAVFNRGATESGFKSGGALFLGRKGILQHFVANVNKPLGRWCNVSEGRVRQIKDASSDKWPSVSYYDDRGALSGRIDNFDAGAEWKILVSCGVGVGVKSGAISSSTTMEAVANAIVRGDATSSLS